MIGHQPTGRLPHILISAVAHEGLTVTVHGRKGRLAVVTEEGTVVAIGKEVAREVMAVAVNCYRNFLAGHGYLRVLSNPLTVVEPGCPPPARRSQGFRRKRP